MTEVYGLSLSAMAGLMFGIWVALLGILFTLQDIANNIKRNSK